jgi:hypothetical protein
MMSCCTWLHQTVPDYVMPPITKISYIKDQSFGKRNVVHQMHVKLHLDNDRTCVDGEAHNVKSMLAGIASQTLSFPSLQTTPTNHTFIFCLIMQSILPPFKFQLPLNKTEWEYGRISDLPEAYIRYLASIHRKLNWEANIVQACPLNPNSSAIIFQAICAAEREVYVGQMLCILREFENHGYFLVECEYAWVRLVLFWWGPYAYLSLESFNTSGQIFFFDCYILRSCFSTPPDLIEFSHSGTEPYEYFPLAPYFWKY